LKIDENVASKSNYKYKKISVAILKVTDKKSRIRIHIHYSEVRIRNTGCYLRLRGAGVVSERHGVASNVVEALVAEGVLVVEQTGCRIPEFKNNNNKKSAL
jgi:hypothetical protein